MKLPILETKMLGISYFEYGYRTYWNVTTYFDDGSVEKIEVPDRVYFSELMF